MMASLVAFVDQNKLDFKVCAFGILQITWFVKQSGPLAKAFTRSTTLAKWVELLSSYRFCESRMILRVS